MTTEEENYLLPLALAAAARAAKAIMEIYTGDADFGIVEKADHTPVTRADMASNAVISEALAPSCLPVLSEETSHEDFDTRSRHRLMWVVDPLDGTKEFIKRNDMFSVCIALVEAHRPVLGVIAVPAVGSVYFTRGGRAWRGSLASDGVVSGEVSLPVNFGPVPHAVLGSVSHPSQATERVMVALRRHEGWADASLVGVGSSIKQCMLAEGAAALYPRSGTTMEWDTAAGQAIMEAAGGGLVKVADGEPLDYNRQDLRNPDFVAFAPGVSPDMVSLAAKAVAGRTNIN